MKMRKKTFWQYQFNYDKWLFMKDIDGSLYEKKSLLVENPQIDTMMGIHPKKMEL